MLKRIASNAVALALGGLVARLVFVSIEVIMARHFGIETYGVFSTVYAIAVTMLVVLDLGMTWQLIEGGSRNPQSIGELLGTTVVLKLIGFAVLYPVATVGLSVLGYDSRTVAFFAVFFPYCLTLAVQDSLAASYTACQRMVVNGLFQGSVPVLIAIFVAAAFALGGGLNAVGTGYVAGGALVTVVWGAMAWRSEHPRVRMGMSGEIVRGSYLYGLTGVLTETFRRSDILMLSALATMPQVGIYAAGYKLLDLAYKVPMLGALVVSPTLFQQQQSDEVGYRRWADAFVRVSAVMGLVLAVVSYSGAPWLIRLIFGSGYDGAATVLRVLSGSFALKFLVASLQTVLTTSGQHRHRTGTLAVATSIALAGHLLLIPRLGAVGAAIAVVSAEALLCLMYLYSIKDTALRSVLIGHVARIGAAAAAAVAAPTLLGLGGPVVSLLSLLVGLAALIGTGYLRMGEIFAVWRWIELRRGA